MLKWWENAIIKCLSVRIENYYDYARSSTTVCDYPMNECEPHRKTFHFSFLFRLVLQCLRIIHCGRASVNDYVVECLQASTPFSLLWINATELNLKDLPAGSCGPHTHTSAHARIRTYNKIWLNWIEQVNLFCCYRFIIIWCVLLCEQCKCLPFCMWVCRRMKSNKQTFSFGWHCVAVLSQYHTAPHRIKHRTHNTYTAHNVMSFVWKRNSHSRSHCKNISTIITMMSCVFSLTKGKILFHTYTRRPILWHTKSGNNNNNESIFSWESHQNSLEMLF